jgi:hypothetical protein
VGELAAVPTLAALHGELSSLVLAGVRLASKAPPPWAALLVGAGVVFLLHGARHRHVLAIPGGAVIGLAAARLVVWALSGPAAPVQVEALWVAAGMGALVCAAWPPIFPVLALAVPGAVIGSFLPVAGRAWMGALAGAAGGGLVGALAREWVASLAAGGLGSAGAIAGAVGLLSKHAIGAALREHPMAVLAIWAILAVAGAAFHAGRAWPGPRAPREAEPYAGDRPMHEGTPDYDGWRG